MRTETQNDIDAISESLELIERRIGLGAASQRLEELDAMSEDPDLWKDQDRARKLMRERQELAEAMESHRKMKAALEDSVGLIELGEAEGDSEVVQEAERAIADLARATAQKEIETLLGGEADANDSFLEINAGAGGTESCDWALMLARMYERWARRRGFAVERIANAPGDEAGIKSTTMRISGRNAYGWLKTESGVHRLVRISPFDSGARRHTSFSAVHAYPAVDESFEADISPSEIRVDTYRSSGSGGQHVNTTDSAVRITHIPTGIVVTSSEKSQHQNRSICLASLKSKLYELELRRRAESRMREHESKGDAGWGNQIRSYVLHPYQMVKDLRTSHETSDTSGVLDGNLDGFMAATLAMDMSGMSRSEAREG